MGGATSLSFSNAVTLLPIGVALHVVEEWPRFPRWARTFASERYSDREYIITHALAVASAVAAAAVVGRWPMHPVVSFIFFGFVLGPGVFWNALFHAGATVVTRTYCPGTITGLVVYLPLSTLLIVLALGERLITPAFLLLSLTVAGVFHVAEVAHNVFKRW